MIHNDISKKSDKYKAVSKAVKRFLEVNTELTKEGYTVQDRHFALVHLTAHFAQWNAVETEIQNSEQIKQAGFKTVQDYMIWLRSVVIADFMEDLPMIREDFKRSLKKEPLE